MTSRIDNQNGKFYVSSALLGVGRGVAVHSLIYPLENIKLNLQSLGNQETIYQVMQRLYKTKGFAGFYTGMSRQIGKTVVKQAWCWPLISGGPLFFEKYGFSPIAQQAMTGLTIACVDAGVTTPFERSKIQTVLNHKKFSWTWLFQEGWKGFPAHWSKLSLNWCLGLSAQQYFRERKKSEQPGKELNHIQLISIGAKIALLVSVISAPLDIMNTLKHSQNIGLTALGSIGMRRLYRGWPLSMLSLCIHNIATVYLIDHLQKFKANSLG